jgi:hypothetical protein
MHIAPGGSDLAELAQAQASCRMSTAPCCSAWAWRAWPMPKRATSACATPGRCRGGRQGVQAARAQGTGCAAHRSGRRLWPASPRPNRRLPSCRRSLPSRRPLGHGRTRHDTAGGRRRRRPAVAVRPASPGHCGQPARCSQARARHPEGGARRPAAASRAGRKRLELLEAGARESTVKAEVAAIVARIAAARPDILKQDVERFKRSADEAENQHRARDRQIIQVETALAAAGAQGLEGT